MKEHMTSQSLYTQGFVFWLIDRINQCEEDLAVSNKRRFEPLNEKDLISEYKQEGNEEKVKA